MAPTVELMVTKAVPEPEAVNGARANCKYRTRQKEYTSQRVKNNEPHDPDPPALRDPLHRVVE